MSQFTIALGPDEEAALAAEAARAGMTNQAFLELWVQGLLHQAFDDQATSAKTRPSKNGQLALQALALCKAKLGKVVAPGDLLMAWGTLDPKNNVNDLEDGIKDLVAKGLLTYNSKTFKAKLTKAGAALI